MLKDDMYRVPNVDVRTICWNPSECEEAVSFLLNCDLIALDIETIPYKKPTKKKGAAFDTTPPINTDIFAMTVVSYTGLHRNGHVESFAFPFQNSKDYLSGAPTNIEHIYAAVRRINACPVRKTLHNGVYDCAWLLYYGLPVSNYAYDSMTMFWSVHPDLPKRLDFVSSILLNHYQYWKGDRKSDSFIEYMHYAMSDTESTLFNTLILARMLLINDSARKNFFHAHMRCLSGLWMSALGLAVDESKVQEVGAQLKDEAQRGLERLRYVVADEEFNPNSPKQKFELLYGILGAQYRTKKGKITNRPSDASTGAIPLKAIKGDHPIFRRVVNVLTDSMVPAKQISNVIKMARFPGGWTGSRLMTSYDGVGTTTTRYSSRASAFGHGSNVQNIRKQYRQIAIPDPDSFLLEIDLSASDDWFIAFESGEQKKIDLARSGRDTHATNALIYFGNWTYDSIVAGKKAGDPKIVHPITGIRQITKKLVHGAHYLMAGNTLLMSAGRDAIVAAAQEEGYQDASEWNQEKLVKYCERLDVKFRNHYPRFQREQVGPSSWYYDLRKEVVSTGGFRTAFDYFQSFLSDPRDDSTLRAVAATAGQAGTAGRINTIMDEQVHGYIPTHFRDGPNPHADAEPRRVSEVLNGITVRLQTHDSITYNVNTRHPRWMDGVAGIFETFSRPVVIKGQEFVVGWEADVGLCWADKKGIQVHNVEQIAEWWEKVSSEKSRIAIA